MGGGMPQGHFDCIAQVSRIARTGRTGSGRLRTAIPRQFILADGVGRFPGCFLENHTRHSPPGESRFFICPERLRLGALLMLEDGARYPRGIGANIMPAYMLKIRARRPAVVEYL